MWYNVKISDQIGYKCIYQISDRINAYHFTNVMCCEDAK